jgi:hypothetical protein
LGYRKHELSYHLDIAPGKPDLRAGVLVENFTSGAHVRCTLRMNVQMVLHEMPDLGQDETGGSQLGVPHYASRGRDELESSRVADTNQG